MDTSGFRDHDGEFPVLDLIASFAFKSATSISFHLGRYSDMLVFADITIPLGPRGVFKVMGRVDVHHPCEGHIKAQLNVLLPAEYHELDRMWELIGTIFEALAIPSDETFEIQFTTPERGVRYENATDREGMSDRI